MKQLPNFQILGRQEAPNSGEISLSKSVGRQEEPGTKNMVALEGELQVGCQDSGGCENSYRHNPGTLR
jgi:hypothetical protein